MKAIVVDTNDERRSAVSRILRTLLNCEVVRVDTLEEVSTWLENDPNAASLLVAATPRRERVSVPNKFPTADGIRTVWYRDDIFVRPATWE